MPLTSFGRGRVAAGVQHSGAIRGSLQGGRGDREIPAER